MSKKKVYVALSLAALGVSAYFIAFVYGLSFLHAFDLDTSTINGTFQLFDPLRRIAAGQIPGKDFFFFHGLGTLYVHYPLFALLGGNLLAGEVVKLFVSFTLGFLSVFLFFFAVSVPFALSVIIGLFFTTFCQELNLGILCSAGNSLLGVRSAMPLLTAALMILLFRRFERTSKPIPYRLFITMFAFFNALSFFMSVEHGLASIAASIVTLILLAAKISKKIQNLIAFFTLFVIFTTLLFYAVSGKYFPENILYALKDVTGDQMWYFGVPPNDFLHSLKQIFETKISYIVQTGEEVRTPYILIFYNITYASFVLLPIFLYRYAKKLNPIETLFSLYLIVYGLLSTLSVFGIFAWQYIGPLQRINIILTIYLVIRLFPALIQKIFETKFKLLTFHKNLALVILIIFVVIYLKSYYGFGMLNQYIKTPIFVLTNDNPFKQKYGVFFDEKWKAHYDTISKTIGNNKLEGQPLPTEKKADWENGIGIKDSNNTSFLVMKHSDLAKVKRNDVLSFASGDKRAVESVTDTGFYTIIKTEGEKLLDPAKDGFPNLIVREDDYNPENYLWSTYTGLPEYSYDYLPVQTDYIIHALGDKKRQKYIDSFKETAPKYVTTTRPVSFNLYEIWLQYTTWDFYEYLIDNYEPIALTPEQVIWERKVITQNKGQWLPNTISIKSNEKFEFQSEELEAEISKLMDNSETENLLVVKIVYEISNPYGFLPFFNKTPRYMLEFENSGNLLSLSLPPTKTEFTFPIYLKKGLSPSFTPKVYSLFPNIELEIKELEYRIINLPAKTMSSLISA